MLRRFLIRLYPRQWRKRYGDEFARLLDDTPLSLSVVANVVRAATHERLFRAAGIRLMSGPLIAYVALLLAQFLSEAVGAQPTFSFEDGHRVVTPPWPVGLGIIDPLIGFAVIGRLLFSFLRQVKVSDAEFARWVLCLFAGAVVQQWAFLETNAGTGIPAWPLWEVWSHAAINVSSRLMFLVLASQGAARISPYGTRRSPGERPLGLS